MLPLPEGARDLFAQRLEQVIRAVSGDARGVILYALAIALPYATGWTAEHGLSRTIGAGARLHAQVSAPHPFIRHERGVRALQYNPARFEHIAVIAGFKRFGDALLDKEQGHAGQYLIRQLTEIAVNFASLGLPERDLRLPPRRRR